MKGMIALIFIALPLFTQGQILLSPQAEIRAITVGPYQGEVYSAFGHSGIRVVDPVNRINAFYNYGIFDYDQPNFYLHFARGFLNYRLAVTDYDRVLNYYAYHQDRYFHEQILNLDSAQNQKLFEFLVWNAKPENMYYYYDYFYDNCATRVRDAIEDTFEGKVEFDGSYISTDYTIRDLTDVYLPHQPWGDLGIDLCLGLPMDKKATPYMYMFLPDYIESTFNNATILKNGKKVPLVRNTIITYSPKGNVSIIKTWITPLVAFIALFVVGGMLTFWAYKKGKSLFWFDATLFSVLGLVGWLLFLLWVATDHKAAARNMNLLWAIPFHFPMGLYLLSSKGKRLKVKYFTAIAILMILLLFSWAFLPQDLHEALIPLTLLVLLRSLYIRYRLSQTNPDE
ncbi:MAG: DUF4105 domain-containing protein [Bacteroidota bacterium]